MSVQRQTTLLAYLDSFMVVGIVCLVALPLVFLMKHDRNAIMGEGSHYYPSNQDRKFLGKSCDVFA